MSKAPLGTQIRTGEPAPESGVYRYVRHTDNSACSATAAEREIPLAKGNKAPPHASCGGHGVIWSLLRYA